MFCMYCGTQLPDEAKFCFKCGRELPDFGSASNLIPDTVPTPQANSMTPSAAEHNLTSVTDQSAGLNELNKKEIDNRVYFNAPSLLIDMGSMSKSYETIYTMGMMPASEFSLGFPAGTNGNKGITNQILFERAGTILNSVCGKNSFDKEKGGFAHVSDRGCEAVLGINYITGEENDYSFSLSYGKDKWGDIDAGIIDPFRVWYENDGVEYYSKKDNYDGDKDEVNIIRFDFNTKKGSIKKTFGFDTEKLGKKGLYLDHYLVKSKSGNHYGMCEFYKETNNRPAGKGWTGGGEYAYTNHGIFSYDKGECVELGLVIIGYNEKYIYSISHAVYNALGRDKENVFFLKDVHRYDMDREVLESYKDIAGAYAECKVVFIDAKTDIVYVLAGGENSIFAESDFIGIGINGEEAERVKMPEVVKNNEFAYEYWERGNEGAKKRKANDTWLGFNGDMLVLVRGCSTSDYIWKRWNNKVASNPEGVSLNTFDPDRELDKKVYYTQAERGERVDYTPSPVPKEVYLFDKLGNQIKYINLYDYKRENTHPGAYSETWNDTYINLTKYTRNALFLGIYDIGVYMIPLNPNAKFDYKVWGYNGITE